MVNLLVTWPHATYRRPPELSRPELLAAYELGAALRLDPEMPPEEYQERVSEMRLDRDSRAAFLAANRRRVEAPLPVWLDLLPYLAYALVAPDAPRRRRLRELVPALAAQAAVTSVGVAIERRAGWRVARARGLTRETGPVGVVPASMWAQFALQFAATHGRRQRPRAVPPSPATALGMRLVRIAMARRAWRAAAMP